MTRTGMILTALIGIGLVLIVAVVLDAVGSDSEEAASAAPRAPGAIGPAPEAAAEPVASAQTTAAGPAGEPQTETPPAREQAVDFAVGPAPSSVVEPPESTAVAPKPSPAASPPVSTDQAPQTAPAARTQNGSVESAPAPAAAPTIETPKATSGGVTPSEETVSSAPVTPESTSEDATPAPKSDSTVSAPQPAASVAAAVEPAAATETQEKASDSTVKPDPDYVAALEDARLSIRGWETDFSLHSVDYNEITSGGIRRDGIAPIDNPIFVPPGSADIWLNDQEPVIALELNGKARAYPLQIMTWHEIVNDTLGGVPVVVTFCPLCNSAIVFSRELDGLVYDFGTSGKLRHSDLIMWDRQTETWWQQFTGDGIVGKLTGKRLEFLPAALVSYADFKSSFPAGDVLSRETGFIRAYGLNPYPGYDQAGSSPFLFDGPIDGRLLAMDRVVSVTVGDDDVAFPYKVLEKERAVNYRINGSEIAVFFRPGTRSALDRRAIAQSRDVGGTGVFDTTVGGQKLTFRADGDKIVDAETGSEWNILGKAVAGTLAGTQLKPVVHGDHFWFSWGAFKPDTEVYKGVS